MWSDRELRQMLEANPDLRLADDVATEVPVSTSSVPAISEHQLQSLIIAECERRSILRVEYGLIFAIPNGGHRHPAVAAKLKAEGVRAGVPDLMLPVARRGYHGAFLELKVSPNKPTEQQLAWIRNLRAEGYACEVIWDDPAKAIQWIESYLEGE